MSIADFPSYMTLHRERIVAALQAGRYEPSPVRRTFIPKKDGGQRPVGCAWKSRQVVVGAETVWRKAPRLGTG
jgi:retron-type reverse transcriptase